MLHSKEQIGRLDRRITLQSMTKTLDVSNSNAESGWADVVTVWSKVDFGSGSERLESDQIKPIQDISFTIRDRTVNKNWRISFDGLYYEIDGVQQLDRNRYIKITAFLREDYAS